MWLFPEKVKFSMTISYVEMSLLSKNNPHQGLFRETVDGQAEVHLGKANFKEM